jgi:hypothetical protein
MVVILLPPTAVTRASYFAYDYHARTHTHTLMRFRYWFNADSLECNHEFELLGVIDASNRLPHTQCLPSYVGQAALAPLHASAPRAFRRASAHAAFRRASAHATESRKPFLVSPGFNERL